MSNTTTNRNLLVIIALLVLTNIAVLGYFLWYKKPAKAVEKEKYSITEMLEKEVGFSASQLKTYKEMKDAQKKVIHPMFDEMRKAKESLFRKLGDTTIDNATLEMLADSIGQRQKAIDLSTITYFRTVRALCTPAQRQQYDSVVIRAFRKMGRAPKGNETKK